MTATTVPEALIDTVPEALIDTVHAALATVDDPEFPGVSIVELGLLESVAVDGDGHVHIGLTPTFSGCPALRMIGRDVADAVGAVDGVTSVEVEWLAAPLWTIDRVTESARHLLAREFTVTVGSGPCPRCGQRSLELISEAGPTRCRAVRRCTSCGELVEQLRI